ncbi:MAG: ATP-binding protein [Pseudonocardiaceae bacterium]
MDGAEVGEVLDRLRRLDGEPSSVEVKMAVCGLPKTVVETVSAFSNTNGGLIILGVDESIGLNPVQLPDPARLRDNLVSAVSDQLEPGIRLGVDLVEVSGTVLVVAKIDPLPSDQRPCYVKSRGISTGSFVRAGDGDRRMTQAEIGLAIANRGQPRYDIEPVPEASPEDLDGAALTRTLARVRDTSRSLRDVDDETALRRIQVLVAHENGKIVPSVAGILTFGVFPQQFFPQLTISLVVIPEVESHGMDAPRFDDNPVIRGAIPDLVAETASALRRHMSVRGYVNGAGRREQLDYPLEAVREAIVNAVLHRDYSPVTRGTQIQIELYPSRLVVRSPGSLYGPVRVEDLGTEGVTSSRNGYLANLLADTYLPRSDRLVAENRASGIPAMIRELRRSGLDRPIFRSLPSRFEVEFRRSPAVESPVIAWADPPGTTREVIATELRRTRRATAAQLVTVAGRSRAAVLTALRSLIAEGVVAAEGDPKSPQRAYRWVGSS